MSDEQRHASTHQVVRHVAGQAASSALAAKGGGVVLTVAALTLGVLALLLGCAVMGAVFQTSTAVWPVPVATDTSGGYRAAGWSVTSGFGWRANPFDPTAAEFHDGLDLAGPAFCRRCPAASLFDATVTYVGWDDPSAEHPEATAGGQTVRIESGGQEYEVLYAHLEPYRLHVQLQGRIRDSYGRYDEYGDYQPVGYGELQPDMGDGAISIACEGDMPRFVATRTAPGTVLFSYDRPATCRTSVSWGRRGDGWDGWIPDEPAGREGESVSLAWRTPLESGRSAGDVALRFRAHLVPPPPPPTATPEMSGTLTIEGRDVVRPEPVAGSSGMAPRCEELRGATRCSWSLASIPIAAERPAAAQGVGSAIRHSFQGTPTRTPNAPAAASPTPTGTSARATPAPEPLFLSLTASHGSPAVGQVFSFSASLFSESAEPRAITVRAEIDPLLELLDVSSTNGSCSTSGNTASCRVSARTAAPATVRVTVRARTSAPPLSQVSARITAEAGEASVADQLTVRLSNLAVTPQPWPPATPVATRTPPATMRPAYPEPIAPTILPPVAPPTAPCFQAVVAALSRQGARYSQGGALPADPRGPDGLPLSRTGPSSFDCSGLVWWAYAQAGVPVGRNTYEQLEDGVELPCTLDDLRGAETRCWAPGDLVFLRYPEGQHVAIYAGQGLFMDCFNHRVGCVLHDISRDSFYRAHFLQARRIVGGCEGMTIDPGAPVPPPLDGQPEGDVAGMCTVGQPSFSGAIETLPGCGPPVRPGDRVFQLDSTVGFVGLTGATTGPHLHLGLRARSYDGLFRRTNICTSEWLRGHAPPASADCWTDMADPLDFLPRALGVEQAPGGTLVPEGAPYQLPPPGQEGALVTTPVTGPAPGQYWSPYADGGRYGGGSALEWLRGASCAVWRGWEWCK
jgi:cell wall-associated NlpC family hydrolase